MSHSLAPKVSLCNRYEALGLEREDIDNGSDQGRYNHIKLVQQNSDLVHTTGGLKLDDL